MKNTTVQLQITTYEAFMIVIKNAIIEFQIEKTTHRQVISEKDARAIASITEHFAKGITNGRILRHDLKLILRAVYGAIGRFFYTFSRRMEAIRNHPSFTGEALSRGDSLAAPEVAELLKQLAEERKNKHDLAMELKAVKKELNQADLDNDQLMQQNAQLKKDIEHLQDYIKSKGLPLPDLMPKPALIIPRRVSDSKLYNHSIKRALTIFPLPTIATDTEPSTPCSTTSYSLCSTSSGEP